MRKIHAAKCLLALLMAAGVGESGTEKPQCFRMLSIRASALVIQIVNSESDVSSAMSIRSTS